jgi:hypothetical protein
MLPPIFTEQWLSVRLADFTRCHQDTSGHHQTTNFVVFRRFVVACAVERLPSRQRGGRGYVYTTWQVVPLDEGGKLHVRAFREKWICLSCFVTSARHVVCERGGLWAWPEPCCCVLVQLLEITQLRSTKLSFESISSMKRLPTNNAGSPLPIVACV